MNHRRLGSDDCASIRDRLLAMAAMGLCARLDADCEMLDVAKATVPSAFRGYVPAQHPALRYRLELGSHVGGGPPAAPSAP